MIPRCGVWALQPPSPTPLWRTRALSEPPEVGARQPSPAKASFQTSGRQNYGMNLCCFMSLFRECRGMPTELRASLTPSHEAGRGSRALEVRLGRELNFPSRTCRSIHKASCIATFRAQLPRSHPHSAEQGPGGTRNLDG